MLIFDEMICFFVYFFCKYEFFMHEINERIFTDFFSLISLFCKMHVQF